MKRVQIKTEQDDAVHLDAENGMNSTLCGLELMGDPRFGIEPGRSVERRINCPACLAMIEACRSLPQRWIGISNQGGATHD